MRELENVENMLNDAMHDLNRAQSEVDQLIDEIQKYQQIEADLSEKVSLLEEELDEQKELNRMLKIDLLEASKVIDQFQKDSLYKMINSPDRENLTVADEIINNLHNK